jgi:dTDP-4-dehydrorhamnose 3,5-epimerase
MAFQFEPLMIPDVILVKTQQWKDARGFFMEQYKQSEFVQHGITATFVQDNYAYSARGVLRGLHYQKLPKAQGKLVMALHGEIFDVAVDLRKGSPTYGKWVGEVLSDQNHAMLYVPTGFAHGYCVLSENAAIWYKVTDIYAPDLDRGMLWNDPAVGIHWPLTAPILSEKDLRLPVLSQADHNFEWTPLHTV